MNSLYNGRVTQILTALHHEAAAADRGIIEAFKREAEASGAGPEKMVGQLLERERADYRALSVGNSERFLAVSPQCGHFLYMMARACRATRIVEFGTSMGISTIFLAAALRDNGGGQLIGSDLIGSKVARARTNVDAAGFSDLVEIREGDALDTLKDVDGEVDMLLLDGAFTLYLPVLKLLEPRLGMGAVVFGENAFDREYLGYVRNPANGYVSEPLSIGDGRGNELTVRAP
jgi:predicted O-methyltransferase YrrM